MSFVLDRTRYQNRANPTTGGWSPIRATPKPMSAARAEWVGLNSVAGTFRQAAPNSPIGFARTRHHTFIFEDLLIDRFGSRLGPVIGLFPQATYTGADILPCFPQGCWRTFDRAFWSIIQTPVDLLRPLFLDAVKLLLSKEWLPAYTY